MNYKKIGIIGAMESEVAMLFAAMEEKTEEKHGAFSVKSGKLAGHDVVIVRSGIGKVNMAACAQFLIDIYGVDVLLNTGIAGSLDAAIDIGDIVLSTDCIQHDMDARAFGYEVGIIPQMKCSVFKADEALGNLAAEVCAEVNPDIKVFRGRVLSGDLFVADKAKKDWLKETFNGSCTEMEGAAMAQVAYMNDVPFLVVRAISDKADDSASMSYDTFEKLAIEHMVRLTEEFVSRL